jgi:hypothetical protein
MNIRKSASLLAPFFSPARHYDVMKVASLLAPYFSPARHYDVMHRNRCLDQTKKFTCPPLFDPAAHFSPALIFRTRPLLSRTRPPLSPARPKHAIPTSPPLSMCLPMTPSLPTRPLIYMRTHHPRAPPSTSPMATNTSFIIPTGQLILSTSPPFLVLKQTCLF